jgi:ribonuclease BN (tRNA processing enzyme)
MRLQILGSSPDDMRGRQYVSSYLIDGVVAVDAGSLGLWGDPAQQSRVRHVFLTHVHIDHLASLPIFIENVFNVQTPPVVVYGSRETLHALRTHLFNDVIWPDFIRLSRPERPFFVTRELNAETPIEVDGLQVVPVQVSHNIPTFGYIFTDGKSTVIFGADSGPTDRIWHLAGQFPEPRTVVLEAAFPDAMVQLAHVSAHLTPALVKLEAEKMPAVRRIVAVHLKVRFRQEIERELLSLNLNGLVVGECGSVYSV